MDDDADRDRPAGEREATRGWPTGEHNPYLVEGEIEQWGKLARGLRHNRTGRRRALRLLLWLAVALAVLIVAVSTLWTPPPR